MPDLDFAFVADYARSKNGGLDALGIGFDSIGVRALPIGHEAFLVLRVGFMNAECGSTHRVEAVVQDADGARITGIHMNVEPHWPEQDPPGDRVNLLAPIPLAMPLTSPGLHSIDISIDGQPVKTIAFQVVVQGSPA